MSQEAEDWIDLGAVEQLRQQELQQVNVGKHKFAVSHVDGKFSVISGICNHVGGPLGEGRLEDGYVVCPWHYWRFHHQTGQAHPPVPAAVPTHATKIENGRLYASASESSKRVNAEHPPHPVAFTSKWLSV